MKVLEAIAPRQMYFLKMYIEIDGMHYYGETAASSEDEAKSNLLHRVNVLRRTRYQRKKVAMPNDRFVTVFRDRESWKNHARSIDAKVIVP